MASAREVLVRRGLPSASGHVQARRRIRGSSFCRERLRHVALHVCVEIHAAATAEGVRVFTDVIDGGRCGSGIAAASSRVVVRDVLGAGGTEGDLACLVLSEALLALGRVCLDVVRRPRRRTHGRGLGDAKAAVLQRSSEKNSRQCLHFRRCQLIVCSQARSMKELVSVRSVCSLKTRSRTADLDEESGTARRCHRQAPRVVVVQCVLRVRESDSVSNTSFDKALADVHLDFLDSAS